MFVASLLMQNHQYQDAMTWLEYIFNPTDNSGGPSPQRFWQMAPFNEMNAADWVNQQIQSCSLRSPPTRNRGSTIRRRQCHPVLDGDPFDPHMVASPRISAYGKATVMKFLDTSYRLGQLALRQYTAEKVSQAEQLYVLADMILGPAPDQFRLPAAASGAPTYASLQHLDMFSNALVNVENLIVAPEPPQAMVQGTAGAAIPATYSGKRQRRCYSAFRRTLNSSHTGIQSLNGSTTFATA